LSRSFFDKDNGMNQQIQRLTADGKTVFVCPGVWKVRKNDNETIEFKEFFRADADNGRPITDGGFYATDDPAEIALLKGNRELAARVYEPMVKVEVDESIKPLAKAK